MKLESGKFLTISLQFNIIYWLHKTFTGSLDSENVYYVSKWRSSNFLVHTAWIGLESAINNAYQKESYFLLFFFFGGVGVGEGIFLEKKKK